MCVPQVAAAALTAATTLYTARKQRKAMQQSERDAEAARVEANRLFEERDTEATAQRKVEEDTRRAEENKRSAQFIAGGTRPTPQRGFGLRLFDQGRASSGAAGASPPTLGI